MSPRYVLVNADTAVAANRRLSISRAFNTLRNQPMHVDRASESMDDDTYACLTKLVAFVEGLK